MGSAETVVGTTPKWLTARKSQTGKPRRLTSDGRADPEGVKRMVASRTVVGGVLGAIAGALILAATTALLTNGPIALVAAIGGAFIGGMFGATWVVSADGTRDHPDG